MNIVYIFINLSRIVDKNYYKYKIYKFNMENNLKAISPVVATALLIVVAVVAAVGFSTWFGSYQSIVNSDLETKTSSSSIGGTGIVGVYNNILYFRNSGLDIIGLTNIKITGTDCVYSGSALPNSIAQIPFDNCSSNLKGIYEIVAEGNDNIYSKKIYLKGTEILSGVLADSPVQGIEYNTSSGLRGITDINGIFKYNSGDNVTFILGNLTLENIPAKNYITPLDIFNSSNIEDLAVVNMVRLFIALDSDSDPDNGIRLDSSKVIKVPSNLDFNQDSSIFDTMLSSEINISIINETTAIKHINKTIKLITGKIEEDNLNEDLYVSCKDILNKNGSTRNGIYYISPSLNSSKKFKVYCDMSNGGWILALVAKNSYPYILLNSASQSFPLLRNVSSAHNINFSDLCPNGECINGFKVLDTTNNRSKEVFSVPSYSSNLATNLTTHLRSDYLDDIISNNWGRSVIYADSTIDSSGWTFWGQTRTGSGSSPVYSWGTGSSTSYFDMEIWIMTNK